MPERLRTLVVSPERELEPGMTVRATFTFRNQGGAPATGVRLRFNVPEGLVYLVGSGRLGGKDLDDELGNSPLLSRGGADIGDVGPGEERRMEIAYSVAGAIENGTIVELQAALASFELPPVGSNVVRLVVRSKPQLRNALTRIGIDGSQEPHPGSQAQVTIRIHNAGQSSAHDVIVVAPIPEQASYVAGSARVNGREIERDLAAPFDRTHAPIVVRSLAANASAVVSYRIALDAPLVNGAQIVAHAQIGSQETPAFSLEAASLTVVSSPHMSEERTMLRSEPSHGVAPGQRITLSVTAQNAGSATAERVSVTIELPEALLFVRGASTIDGRPVRERRKEPLRFTLGAIEAGESVTLRVDAVVAAPLPDGTMLAPSATLQWEPGDAHRRLECTVTIHSEPAFPPRRNGIERRGTAVVRPGDALEAMVTLANDGSAAANDGVLHVRLEPALDEVAIFEGATRLSFERDTVELGTLDAYGTRKLTLRARVPSPCPDRTELRVAPSLHTRELGETPLREAFWRVDSHPAFRAESSRLELSEESVLRPNQLAQIDVVVTNAGSDTAHNVALRLYVSPEARLESVDGATREKSSLLFGELAPSARARARVALRLLRSLAKEYPVTVDAVLTADAMLPVPLTRLTIATAAEPDFSVGRLFSHPAETAEAGEIVEWTLQLRNGGDGVAHHVAVSIALLDSLIYVPNSTTVNDVPVRDAGALPPFAAEGGISLNEVDPGVEPTIRWQSVVHNALRSGTAIVHVAQIRYDGEREDEVVSPELVVRSGPVFANAIPGLPFGLDGLLGPAPAGELRAITQDRFLELPPATPVSDGNGVPYRAQLAAASTGPQGAPLTATLASFTGDRVARTLRFLREARFGGLVTHLFALRAFLPDAIGDARCGALEPLRDSLREEFDRLFIKLRLPRYAIVARDIETPSLRTAVDRLLDEAAAARGAPPDSPMASLELRGTFSRDELRTLYDRALSSELASAPPWAALARLLPDDAVSYAEYRSRLIERLDAFAGSEPAEFVEALQREQDAALDSALDAICASLHAIA